MSREEYLRLCQICDNVLQEKASSVSMAAIAWLHVLNEHPSNQLKYQDLFHQSPAIKQVFYHTVILAFIRSSINSIKSSFRKSPESIFNTKNKVLFISHLLNADQIIESPDFYFGMLPEILTEKGIPATSILVNHSGLANVDLKRRWEDSRPFKTPLPDTLNPFEELYIRILLLKQSIRLKLKSRVENDSLKKKIYAYSAHEALSKSSIFSLRTYLFVKKVLSKCNTRVVVTTFEGHAFERIIFAAANTAKKKVYSLGYHHTILFPEQHATFRKVDKKFRPDCILTAGNITKDEFSKSFSSIPTHNIGIHRTKSTSNQIPDIQGKPPACIILPDGILSEVLILFRLAILTANLLPEITFILRLHPVLKKDELLIKFPEFGDLPTNVSFSRNDFNKDLQSARWALYRGSNSAIYAVIEGLRPVYVSLPNELPIDSINSLKSWKKVITLATELVDIINEDLISPKKKLENESSEAINFCKQYFMPLDAPEFLNIIDSCWS